MLEIQHLILKCLQDRVHATFGFVHTADQLAVLSAGLVKLLFAATLQRGALIFIKFILPFIEQIFCNIFYLVNTFADVFRARLAVFIGIADLGLLTLELGIRRIHDALEAF